MCAPAPPLRSLSLPFVAWLAAGCGADSTPRPASTWTERDSAGVTIAEQRLDSDRSLHLEEVWRIGSLDGDEATQFFTPRDAVLGADGRVYLLDSGNHRVKVFDAADGRFLHAFGSQGEGPGEFQVLAYRLTLADDLLVVTDAGRRIHAFRPDGTHVRTVATGTLLPPGTIVGTPAFDGARWLIDVSRYFDVERGIAIPTQPTALVTLDLERGVLGDSAGLVWESGVERPSAGPWTVLPLYREDPLHWLDERGRLVRGDGSTYALEWWESDGRLSRRVINHTERFAPDPADLDRVRAAREEQCRERPNSECEPFLKEGLPAILALPLPGYKPTLYQLDGGPDGTLLVLRADLGWDLVDGFTSKTYDLFAADGRFRGRFTMPPSFRVVALNDGHLLAIERDELDVESLVLYRWSEP